MSRPVAASALALMTPMALTACDSLRGPDNPGNVLAELQVEITDTRDAPSGPVHLSVSWFHSPELGEEATEPEIEIEIADALPATTRLPIYTTPPLTALHADALPSEFKLGVGYLIAWVDDPTGDYSVVGIDPDHYVIYAPSDVPAGSFASKLLHGTPRAGYHIYAVRALSPSDADDRRRCYDELPPPLTWEDIYECGGHPAYQEIGPAPADLATPLSIELSDNLNSLDPLLWFSL